MPQNVEPNKCNKFYSNQTTKTIQDLTKPQKNTQDLKTKQDHMIFLLFIAGPCTPPLSVPGPVLYSVLYLVCSPPYTEYYYVIFHHQVAGRLSGSHPCTHSPPAWSPGRWCSCTQGTRPPPYPPSISVISTGRYESCLAYPGLGH